MSGDGMRIVLDSGGRLAPVVASILVLFLALILYRKTFPPLSAGRRVVLAGCRVAALWLLVVFLADPSLVTTRTERRPPLVVALLDVSRSMGIADESGGPRLDAALDALGELREAFLSRSDAELRVFPFAGATGVEPLDPAARPDATGEGSDIVGAVRDVLAGHRGRIPAAVVLLSDGRVTRGMIEAREATPVPVWAVPFGDPVEPPDAAIERIDAERIVYLGTRTTVEATVSLRGLPGEETAVDLLDGERRLAGAIAGGDGTTRVDLSWIPRREGTRQLTVRMRRVEGEERLQNNEEEISVEVRRSRIRVLLADRFVDWNATLLGRMAERSPRFDLSVAAGVPGGGYRLLGKNGAEWTARDLDGIDVLLVADDDELLAKPDSRRLIRSWVEEGGGLALLADERSPLLGTAIADAGCLPVGRLGTPRIEPGGFAVEAAAAAGGAFPLAFEAAAARADPPPLPLRIAGLGAVAGAEVPLVFADGGPCMAMHRVGDGIVATVLGYPLWRWALDGEGGTTMYETFFGGLFQLLAEGGEPAFAVRSERSAWAEGETVRLEAEANGGRTIEAVRGVVERIGAGGTEAVAAVEFSPVEGRRGRFEALVDPLPPGKYRVVATRIGDGRAIEADAVFSVRPVSVEFLRVASDREALARLADASGGALVERGDIGRIPGLINATGDRITRRESRSLREGPPLFLLAVLLLGAEWALRKAWGLV